VAVRLDHETLELLGSAVFCGGYWALDPLVRLNRLGSGVMKTGRPTCPIVWNSPEKLRWRRRRTGVRVIDADIEDLPPLASPAAGRLPFPRQEPGAVIPPVRICAGGTR